MWTKFDRLLAGRARHVSALRFVFAFVAMSAAAEADADHRFRGDAYDLKTGAFVYSENHSAFHKGNERIYSRVSYRDKTGHEFASKLITFAPVKTQPTYELNDTRDGYMEGIRREAGKTVYYARRAKSRNKIQSGERTAAGRLRCRVRLFCAATSRADLRGSQ